VRRGDLRRGYVTLTVLQLDFRQGGTYRFAYKVPGRQVMTVRGAYRSIEPPDEHAGLESEVSVTIMPDGEVTELLIRHEKLTRPGAGARHAEGWRGALDQLTALLEPSGRSRVG
jgi:uncharacterized protein YndB with AHSA1/START domain